MLPHVRDQHLFALEKLRSHGDNLLVSRILDSRNMCVFFLSKTSIIPTGNPDQNGHSERVHDFCMERPTVVAERTQILSSNMVRTESQIGE